MSEPRVYLPRLTPGTTKIILRNEVFHHLVHVLSLSCGNEFYIYGWNAEEARVVVQEVGKDYLVGEILSHSALSSPSLNISVFQAVLKENAMDDVIQGLGMLGVQRLIPFYSHRSVPKPHSSRTAHKLARWEKIAIRSASLSHLPTPMSIQPPRSFSDVMTCQPSAPYRFILWEEERESPFKPFLESHSPERDIWLMVGPEGGFDSEEVEFARKQGWVSVGLGPWIFSAPIAGIIAITLLQAFWGDLGK